MQNVCVTAYLWATNLCKVEKKKRRNRLEKRMTLESVGIFITV